MSWSIRIAPLALALFLCPLSLAGCGGETGAGAENSSSTLSASTNTPPANTPAGTVDTSGALTGTDAPGSSGAGTTGAAGSNAPAESTEATNAPASESTEASSEAPAKPAGEGKPVPIVIETSKGTIEAELYPAKAPITVKNFLGYAKKGHYNGTIFHRVIPGFMVQGGGFTADMREKSTGDPIKNEAGNGLLNTRGTLAMARTSVVDSATSQFFINVGDNEFLNHKDETPEGFGYAVFGKVTKGMDVVDKIVGVPTTSKGPHENVPVDPITIKGIKAK